MLVSILVTLSGPGPVISLPKVKGLQGFLSSAWYLVLSRGSTALSAAHYQGDVILHFQKN